MESRSTKRGLSTLALETWLFALRSEMKLTKFQLSNLRNRNINSRDSIVSNHGGPVVSLTTYGERLKTVHFVIESIAAGTMLPSRLILWVDTPEAHANPCTELKRLMDRGLEIRLSENFGPHTKYYPYLLSTDTFPSPLVTADDDQLYNRWWLEGMARSHEAHPDNVSCYRAHSIRVADKALAPYESWGPCQTTSPSFLHFGTGVSGCIYPPSLLYKLKQAGSIFMELCPKADDAWLHVNATRAGIKTRQIWSRPLRFPFVPGTQSSGLYHSNVLQSQNDKQISETYTAADTALLRAAVE